MRVDLHIHSTASDGRWTPQQLVEQVQRAGIDLFAVADHDSVANVLSIERLVRGSGLGLIRAVEVSTTLDGHLFHLVAYGIDPEKPSLLHVLCENQEKMEGVDRQSIRLLMDAGYRISLVEYETYEDDATRGGWKALNLFIDKGFCRDVKDFFGRLFVGNMALTLPTFAAPDEAVRVIRQAGGLAICAHPGHSARDGGADLLEQLLACGIDGLECYSPYHDEAMTQRCLEFCRRHGLLVTAGSDCHGGFVGRPLGMPEAYIDDLNLGPLLEHIIR